jgi:hypothetical protein
MDLSSNWGMYGVLRGSVPGFGDEASDGLSVSSCYLKLTKLAKIHKKA